MARRVVQIAGGDTGTILGATFPDLDPTVVLALLVSLACVCLIVRHVVVSYRMYRVAVPRRE